jgi:hypothetical protein
LDSKILRTLSIPGRTATIGTVPSALSRPWLGVAGLALFMGLFAVRQLLGLRNASMLFLVPTILIAGSQLTQYIWTRRLLRQATRVI